jgi:hypothetical protein
MLIIIKTQREYLIELTDDKQKLLNEKQQLLSELLLNSNKMKEIRKNHIRDLVKYMEINMELEKKINEITKQNQCLIDEKTKISKELSNEIRTHAETRFYYEGRYYHGKCICVKDEYLCPDCRIEGKESNDTNFIPEQNDKNDMNNIGRIANRIENDDDVDDILIEKSCMKDNIDETIPNNIDYDNSIDIENTVSYYNIDDEKLPLIERIDRCLNNVNTQDKNEFILCYDSNNKYNHKKCDDDDENDEFNYFMINGKNGYIDDYLSNRV